MNPIEAELFDEGGNANSALMIIGWFFAVLLLNIIFKKFKFSKKTCIRIWACVNFAPLAWIITLPHVQFLAIIGIGAVLFFSFVIGKSVFEENNNH